MAAYKGDRKVSAVNPHPRPLESDINPKLGIGRHEQFRLLERRFKSLEEMAEALKTRTKKKKKKKEVGLESQLEKRPKLGPLTEDTLKKLIDVRERRQELIDKVK